MTKNRTNSSTEISNDALKRKLEIEIENHRKTKIRLKLREHENHAITTSRSYRLAKAISGFFHVLRILFTYVKSLGPKRLLRIANNKRHVREAYADPEFAATLSQARTADLAIIIHLYYTDMLPLFMEKLGPLSGVKYDLYLSVPEHKKDEIAQLQIQAPNARIITVPNCGRDVLPFIQVMKGLEDHGYTKVLKLHTKKSPHRDDGDEWRDRILDKLIPTEPSALEQILKQLDDKNTALIGPADEYVSLLVNLNATIGHLKRVVRSVCGEKQMDYLLRHPDEFGFFGGTMFWARFDALLPVINVTLPTDFEPEEGQEDSTLAHALERTFNVIPELQARTLFEIQGSKIKKRDYETTNIPTWAEYSIDS
jgi:lipopolysaccharide biosynthesis protein